MELSVSETYIGWSDGELVVHLFTLGYGEAEVEALETLEGSSVSSCSDLGRSVEHVERKLGTGNEVVCTDSELACMAGLCEIGVVDEGLDYVNV